MFIKQVERQAVGNNKQTIVHIYSLSEKLIFEANQMNRADDAEFCVQRNESFLGSGTVKEGFVEQGGGAGDTSRMAGYELVVQRKEGYVLCVCINDITSEAHRLEILEEVL